MVRQTWASANAYLALPCGPEDDIRSVLGLVAVQLHLRSASLNNSAFQALSIPVPPSARSARGRLRRLYDAIIESRQRKAAHDIARYLHSHGNAFALNRRQAGKLSTTAASALPEQRYHAGWERLRATFVTAREVVSQWRRRVRMRTELATLSNGDLRDIRWTKAEVEAERRKPFWRP
jgi:uncharacterized protein YjiS (DUF1127 family)